MVGEWFRQCGHSRKTARVRLFSIAPCGTQPGTSGCRFLPVFCRLVFAVRNAELRVIKTGSSSHRSLPEAMPRYDCRACGLPFPAACGSGRSLYAQKAPATSVAGAFCLCRTASPIAGDALRYCVYGLARRCAQLLPSLAGHRDQYWISPVKMRLVSPVSVTASSV